MPFFVLGVVGKGSPSSPGKKEKPEKKKQNLIHVIAQHEVEKLPHTCNGPVFNHVTARPQSAVSTRCLPRCLRDSANWHSDHVIPASGLASGESLSEIRSVFYKQPLGSRGDSAS